MKISNEDKNLIRIAHQSDANVLITGATGTGKTSLAKEIHLQSPRQNRPFVSVNLATLHEGTLESELFGHEKGAFTGADLRRVGRFEMAQGGTVFLDEVGELTPRLQARLLDFLQSKVINPVGSNREIRLDVRVIAATHKDLEKAVSQNEFRQDLFHRLRVISIHLKSLVERQDEFNEIVHYALEELVKTHQKSVHKISEEVAQKLESYPWPGNIRELRNVLEYAVLVCQGTEIVTTDLPVWFLQPSVSNPNSERLLGVAEVPLTLDFQDTISRFEKEYLEKALFYFRGRVNRTARGIGLNKSTLVRRLQTYGIQRSR